LWGLYTNCCQLSGALAAIQPPEASFGPELQAWNHIHRPIIEGECTKIFEIVQKWHDEKKGNSAGATPWKRPLKPYTESMSKHLARYMKENGLKN
jgi:hypothetical protein